MLIQLTHQSALLRGGQDIPRGIHGESRAMVRKRARFVHGGWPRRPLAA